jgi:WD40 repeat protein
VFEVPDGKLVWSTQIESSTELGDIALSPDGLHVVIDTGFDAESQQFNAKVVDISTNATVAVLHTCNPLSDILFSDDGSRLITADWCSDVVVYDSVSWDPIVTLGRGRGGAVSDAAVQGDLVATVGYDDMLRIRSFVSSELIAEIPLAQPSLNVEFLENGHVLVLGRDGTFYEFATEATELLAIASERLVRSFSEEECIVYEIDPCPTLDELRARQGS